MQLLKIKLIESNFNWKQYKRQICLKQVPFWRIPYFWKSKIDAASQKIVSENPGSLKMIDFAIKLSRPTQSQWFGIACRRESWPASV